MAKKCPIDGSLGEVCADGRWCAECQDQFEQGLADQERQMELGLESALMVHLPDT